MIMGILSLVFGGIFKLVPGLAGKYFDHLEQKANTETERMKVRSIEQQHLTQMQAQTIQHAMGFKVFWVAWSLIAIPFACWLGMGYADSLFNGALPDVASLPPQLKEYGDTVMANIFVSGGIVAGVQGASRTIGNAIQTRGTVPADAVVLPDGRVTRKPIKDYKLPKGK